jgi:HEPN domain-containing protein
MLSRAELKRISTARLQDADILLKARRYDGAMYLCGYAIELGLKLRICKTLHWPEFPETSADFKDLQSFKTHDFNALLRLSGIEATIKTLYLVEWSIVRQWKPELRYSKTKTISPQTATDRLTAAKLLLKAL